MLHEVAAASGDSMKDVAEEMLMRDRELLFARNNLGGTPIFCAARYGQTEMFKFLAGEMKLTERTPKDGDNKHYLQRNDGTTVLHVTTFTEFFREFFLSTIQGPPISFKFFERNIWLNTSNNHKFNYKSIPSHFFPENFVSPY